MVRQIVHRAFIRDGLDGFLVVERHAHDDVPIGLFADRKSAERLIAAKPCWWGTVPGENVNHSVHTQAIGHHIVEFRDGRPVKNDSGRLWLGVDREGDMTSEEQVEFDAIYAEMSKLKIDIPLTPEEIAALTPPDRPPGK